MKDLPDWLQRASLDQAPVGITIADASDPELPVVHVNRRFVEMTGYPREDVIGRNCRFLQGPDTDEATVDRIREGLDAQEPVSVVIRNYRRDGTPFWNQLDISPVRRDGEVTHYFGFQKDVTERVELRRELERRNERLDEYVKDVSHDLRNPLNVARGRVELAREGADGQHLSDVEDAIDRMVGLVDDLVSLSGESQRSAVESVDLAAAATEAWKMVATGEATLDTDGAGDVRADRSRLLTVLENLFRNAVEHGGAATLSVESGEGWFAVADDGSGIPPDERERVFERGFTTNPSGTGFGLAIVQDVAEDHGWEVSLAESDTGGTRFVFST